MLPANTGNLQLSEDSRHRLDSFYQRFCTGEYGDLYGIGHLLYACHAAFPLLLSPGLANQVWLNFNSYENASGFHRIAPVAVSDFLLSPLVRTVGNRQVEMIPEIRNYLLFLLNDGRWLRSRGIKDTTGMPRLEQLSQFLNQYIGQGQADTEHNAAAFKQLNRWAALAYLSPDTLALEMAQSFRDTFTSEGQPDLEHDQLRLNMLIDRFGQQMRLDIYDKVQDSSMFQNLGRYSIANKARLFGKQEDEVSDLFLQLEDTYLEKTPGNTISLPVPVTATDRLIRKKDKVQRVVPLLIGIDAYKKGRLRGAKHTAMQFDEALQGMGLTPYYDIVPPARLFDQQATEEAFRQALDLVFTIANDEDIVLVYFSGLSIQDQEGTTLFFYKEEDNQGTVETGIRSETFKSWLNQARGRKACQIVLLLDTCANGYEAFVDDRDIQLSAVSTGELQLDRQIGDSFGSAFNDALISIMSGTGGRITYADLLRVLRVKIAADESVEGERPVLLADSTASDTFFLSREAMTVTGQRPLICYSNKLNQWLVAANDFFPPALSVNTGILDYHTNEKATAATGEIYMAANKPAFGGGTETLNQDQVYALQLMKIPLVCDHKKSMKEMGQLLPVAADEASVWSSLQIQQGVPRVYDLIDRMIIENAGEDKVTATFRQPDRMKDRLDIRWTISRADFAASFRKFSRYHYLQQLILNKDKAKIDIPLDVQVLCGLQEPGEERVFFNEDGRALVINEHSFHVRQGQLRLKPLVVELASREQNDLFFDLYLLTTTFAIRKLKTGIHKIGANDRQLVTCDINDFVQEALVQGVDFVIKVLFSRDPIHSDFSQTGIAIN